MLSAQLSKPSFIISQQQRIHIAEAPKTIAGLEPLSDNISFKENNSIEVDSDIELPYRYHEQQQDIILAGWRLPAHYVFNADKLQNWLLKLPNWQRIKGVIHTSDGWLQMNFTPDSLTTSAVSAQLDSRLEVILQQGTEQEDMIDAKIDWEAYDRELMAMIMVN